MKKLFAVVLVFLFSFSLISCGNKTTVSSIEVVVSKDYGKVIEFAKTEFTNIFKEYENAQLCYEKLSKKYNEVYLCKPVNSGIIEIA